MVKKIRKRCLQNQLIKTVFTSRPACLERNISRMFFDSTVLLLFFFLFAEIYKLEICKKNPIGKNKYLQVFQKRKLVRLRYYNFFIIFASKFSYMLVCLYSLLCVVKYNCCWNSQDYQQIIGAGDIRNSLIDFYIFVLFLSQANFLLFVLYNCKSY